MDLKQMKHKGKRMKKKKCEEVGRTLKKTSDVIIKKELMMLPYALVPASDSVTRGAMLWLALLQGDEQYNEILPDILKEIRALDEFMCERGETESGGLPTFFAYLYYMMLWNNSMSINPEFQKMMEIANTLTMGRPEGPDVKRGYA